MRITGKSGKVKLASTEVIDIVNWTLDGKLDDVDATVMQDTWKNFLGTFLSWEATAEAVWEPGVNTAFWDQFILATAATVDLFPVAANTEKWSGSAFISFGEKVSKDGVVMQMIKFRGTGTLTHTA